MHLDKHKIPQGGRNLSFCSDIGVLSISDKLGLLMSFNFLWILLESTRSSNKELLYFLSCICSMPFVPYHMWNTCNAAAFCWDPISNYTDYCTFIK